MEAQVNEDRIFDKLNGIEEQNRQMLVSLTRVEEQVKEVPELRVRVRALENWRWTIVGALAAGGGSLVTQLATVITKGS